MVQGEGVIVWLTGLSSAGKTTLATALAARLCANGRSVEVLDGDGMRKRLSPELGFSRQDRIENIRRIGYVATLLARHGVVVVVAAISPYRKMRERARMEATESRLRFVEVYVNAPLAVCEQRDVKGLYRKARAGELRQFTGIDDVYESPEDAEVECRTDAETVEESVERILAAIWYKERVDE